MMINHQLFSLVTELLEFVEYDIIDNNDPFTDEMFCITISCWPKRLWRLLVNFFVTTALVKCIESSLIITDL
jgi:hypothetical protein